jgi:hypothetical protein
MVPQNTGRNRSAFQSGDSMKRALLLLPVLLAGCHSGPSVTAENATANEVDAKLAQSGGVSQFLSPGHWDSVATVHDVEVPGMPPSAAAQMKTMIGKPATGASCLTPEEAKKPAGSFFAGDESDCRYDHFTMADGTIDAAMTCKGEHATQTVALKGTYSADTFHIDRTTKSNGAGPMADMTMAMTVDAKRTGACTGKEEDAEGG